MSHHKRLEPAKSVIARFGGIRPTARVLGISPSAVMRWMLPRHEKGTDGNVPLKHWQALINYAKKEQISLTVAELSNVR